MKIILNNEEKYIELKPEAQEEIIKNINQLNGENILSHVIIDGREVYTEIEAYIEQNMQQINVIQIISKSKKEYINDTLILAEEYLQKGTPLIEELSEKYYQNASPEDKKQFQDLIEGLTWLTNILVHIDSLKERPSNWEAYVAIYHQLEEGIKSLVEALENNDEILMADILQYEIVSAYGKLSKLITNSIDTEGSRPNAN